jgi:hypothetical protein
MIARRHFAAKELEMVITRVAPVSAAKIAGMLYVIVGLVIGAFVSLAAIVGGMAANQEGSGGLGVIFGAGAIILLPLLYGCMGFVMTLLMTWLFNVAAGITGGVEVDVR